MDAIPGLANFPSGEDRSKPKPGRTSVGRSKTFFSMRRLQGEGGGWREISASFSINGVNAKVLLGQL